MKYIFYDCDNCCQSSTPQPKTGAAISKAIEEGFIFIGRGKNRKVYCSDCYSNKLCTCERGTGGK